MSYDIHFEIDTGGIEPACVGPDLNYTYNCAPMFIRALGGNGINDLNGITAGDTIVRLRVAVAHISDLSHRDEYVAMVPANGWGSWEGARSFLEAILLAASAHPKSTIRIC